MKWRARAQILFLSAVILLLVLGAWAFVIEPGRLLVREYSVAVPSRSLPMRIAVVSDLHVGAPHNGLDKLRQIIAATQRARPDLIVLLGDFVIQDVAGGEFIPPERIAPELRRLRAPLGVFAVLGNHDWWLDAPRVRAALERARIPVLDDSATLVRREHTAFWIGGVSDFWEGAHDIGRTLSFVNDSLPVILITHNPDIFPDVPARVTLTLAGHTHGGQVRLPLLGAPVVPSRYGQRYARGLIREDGRTLFVNTGTGMSILPVRFGVPPEISILTLKP